MKKFLLALLFVCVAIPASAQSPPVVTVGSKLVWDQVAPDLATANGYKYTAYLDAAAGVDLVTPVCTGFAGLPFTCTVAFPPMSQGSHSVALTASNAFGPSARSTAYAFGFVATPNVPGRVRSTP